MASSIANEPGNKIRPIRTKNNQFDDLTLIWLDAQIDSNPDCLHAKARLRLIVNVVKTFNDINTCLTYIQSQDNNDEPIGVIVSGALSDELIPAIINLPQIACIAIYCFDELRYSDTISNYSSQSAKIIGIFSELDPLLDALNKRITMLRESLLLVSSFAFSKLEDQPQKSVKDLSQENANFVWFQLLIQTLIRLPRTDTAREKMIRECERQYDENPAQLSKIKEFAETYQPNDAVPWYTRDSFVYRIINRALRTQDIDIILKFHPFIGDLHDQLKVLHAEFLDFGPSPVLTAYRGQQIHINELNKIKQNVGHLLSMNSFFSTGLDRALAREFAGDKSQTNADYVSILYEIKIDTNVNAAPYSSVGRYSQFRGEEEFLFSIGAIFRIESVKEVTDELGLVWLVTIRLVDERDNELNDLYEYLKTHIGETSSLFILAGFLFLMDKLTAAEHYYNILRDELPKDHPDQPTILNNLGEIRNKTNRTQEALDFYDQALKGYATNAVSRPEQIAITYGNIATVYNSLGNFERAEAGFRKVLELQQSCLNSDDELFITTRNNLASILLSQGKLQEALEQFEQALALCHRVYKMENHPTLGTIEGNIGNIYDALGRVNEAIVHFERSLAIHKRCLPPGHYSLVSSHANLGHMYMESGNYAAALNQFEAALAIEKQAGHGSQQNPLSLSNIFHGFSSVYLRQDKPIQALVYAIQALKILPTNHPNKAFAYRQLGVIYRDMGAYEAAAQSYQQAIALCSDDELKLAEYFHSLGLIQDDQGQRDQSIDTFKRALEIRKRLLPPLHPDIAQIFNELGGVFLAKEHFQEALDYFNQARNIQLQSLSENHIEIARTSNNIGVTLFKLNRPEEALIFVNQAVEIAQKILDESNSLRIMFEKTAYFVRKRVETGNDEGVGFGVK